jgi:hypothetical protein
VLPHLTLCQEVSLCLPWPELTSGGAVTISVTEVPDSGCFSAFSGSSGQRVVRLTGEIPTGSGKDDLVTPMINASHLDVVITEEIHAAEDARWRRQDAPSKSGISPAPPAPKPKPSEPKPPAPKPSKKTPQSPTPRAKKPPSESAKPPPAPELPPGSLILSPAEAEAVDEALDYYLKHHAKRHR